MTEIIVEARTIVTGVQDRHTPIVHDNAAVLVRDGVVVEVGDPAALRAEAPDATVHRYPRHVMLPGFVNSHHHVGLTPLQLGSPDHALELWFATRIAAKRVDHELDTLYSAFEMLASASPPCSTSTGGWPAATRRSTARPRRCSAPIARSGCGPPTATPCASRTASSTRPTRPSANACPSPSPGS